MKTIRNKHIESGVQSEALASPDNGKAGNGATGLPGNAALQLLTLDDRMRQSATPRELTYLLVNDTMRLLDFEQAFAFSRAGKNRWKMIAATSLAQVNRDAPTVTWLENTVAAQVSQNGLPENGCLFALPAYADPNDPVTVQYPLREMLWMPLPSPAGRKDMPDGLLLTRRIPFDSNTRTFAQHIAATAAHAYKAMTAPTPAPVSRIKRRVLFAVLTLAIAGVGLIPVPLTTLAPAEIVAREPWVVSAQMPGVIESIQVQPNQAVNAGDPLFTLNDTELRAEFDIAERKLAVAQARLLQARQAATEDSAAKRELAIFKTESDLAGVERDYAASLLEKTVVRASRDGLVLYGDPQDWLGQPVSVGQAVMQIAEPRNVSVLLRIPVADATNLQTDRPVRLFLDAQPLDPLDAILVRTAYKAEAQADGTMAFKAYARLNKDDQQNSARQTPQLGLRGTAQISGDPVTLAYYLFRRPLIALRQWTGL